MSAERDELREFDRWCFERRRAISRGEAECGAEEALLDAIREKIKTETNAENRRSFKFMLSSEYASQDRFAEAEAVLLELNDETPDRPLPLISLAGHKLYYERKPEAAMPIIDRAIEIAYRTGIFRRLALGTKARAALELRDYPVVEDILRQLMGLKFGPAHVDCGIERDFFDRLPVGAINDEVARRYNEFSSEKRKVQRP
jgi:hypothetical protein